MIRRSIPESLPTLLIVGEENAITPLEGQHFAVYMMKFRFKTMDFVSKMMNFTLKLMDLTTGSDQGDGNIPHAQFKVPRVTVQLLC